MSKCKKCAICGQPLTGMQYHKIFDYFQGSMVNVCRDYHLCQNRKVNQIETSREDLSPTAARTKSYRRFRSSHYSRLRNYIMRCNQSAG